MDAKKWIIFSGLTWLAIGSYLMVKGLHWITRAMMEKEIPALMKGLIGWMAVFKPVTLQQGALILICAALLIGFIKGRMILSKSVDRVVAHLRSQGTSIPWKSAYDPRYFAVLAAMMGLGLLMKFLPLGMDLRGFIDVTIGSALINGAMLYFREALIPKTRP